MTKRFSALAVSAAIAGGLLFASVPAHAAGSAHSGAVLAKATITCNRSQMRQQIAALKEKAAKLKQLGEPEAARKALSDAAALQRKLDACIKAEDNQSKPFPG
ncbi:hypothetical protein [Streptomyces cyanogenus]|uniref:Uncharacterized protein n=1 Tax=Streptomyces cyanogenus TaxID=80860 RepID=A0ABX7THG7_STRCY|nr:hypothetical protein [Streptomyces cyanogenus]QTD95884.1 hypothetical protein S1361_00935 [Streptomyces cyanogenus]